MTTKTKNAIKKALAAFGLKGHASCCYIAHDRVKVMIDGGYFGIFDCEKNTFVD